MKCNHFRLRGQDWVFEECHGELGHALVLEGDAPFGRPEAKPRLVLPRSGQVFLLVSDLGSNALVVSFKAVDDVLMHSGFESEYG